MSETIFGAQTFPDTDGIAGTSRSLGMEWQTSLSGQQVSSIRIRIPDDGPFADTRAQFWLSGAVLPLQDINIGAAGVAGAWYTVPGFVTQAIVAATDYIVNLYIPGTSIGNYNFEDPGGPITNGSITAHSIYRNGGLPSLPPNLTNFPSGLFGADILLEAASTGATGDAGNSGITVISLAPAGLVSNPAGLATIGLTAFDVVGSAAQPAGLATVGTAALNPAALTSNPAGLAPVGVTAYDLSALLSQPAGLATVGVAAFDATAFVTVTGFAATADVSLAALAPGGSASAGALGLASIGVTAYNAAASNMLRMSTDFSPCDWDPIQCCVWPTGSEAVTGYARQSATEVLWQKSGQRYGLCEITIRPCRRSCGSENWPFMDRWYEWAGGMWPRPLLYNGLWFNIACGGCPGTCSCAILEEVLLPGVVSTVSQVKVDGVILPSSAYRLDDNQLLVRTDGGRWPYCQDMAAADTQPNTWSVTFTFGEVPPVIGRQAVGQLMCALARECMGEDCRLPSNVTSLVRQGVSVELDSDFLKRFNFVSLFLDYANPAGLIAAPGIYDPDAQMFRRPGA